MQKYFEKIIERLEELMPFQTVTETLIDRNQAIMAVNQVAEECNQSLTNDGWIPVSSGELPTEYETVLCVTDAEYGGYYYVAVYTSEHGFRTEEDYVNGELIAWKPIKPYQPKGEQE